MPSGVVLIGSGPSLNRIDPRKLAGLDTIAFNRSWLAWDDWGFAPRYHACLDPASIAILGPELPPVIARHRSTRFFLHRDAARAGIAAGGNVTLCDLAEGTRFADALATLTDFGNVGAVSMQVLHLLGYRKILLVGVDGDYLPEKDVDNDANHFRDDYARGRLPLTPVLRARYTGHWPVVAAECKRHGIDVRNASPGTVLTCFDAINFDDGLAWLSSGASHPRNTTALRELNS
jgi:hypothetical protein